MVSESHDHATGQAMTDGIRAPAPGAAHEGRRSSAVAPLDDDLFHRDALTLAEQSAGIGVWSIDLATGMVRGTAQFFHIMGLQPVADQVPVDTIRALRHPHDRDRVLAGFRQTLEGTTDAYEIEYRIIRPDGEERWIFGRGRVVRDAAGTPIRYSGVDLDITQRKAAQAALTAAKEALERMNVVLEQRVQDRTAALEQEAAKRMQAEARLHQAQKMEAVGQLTGGIAHDFNNILQVILGNLDIAARVLQSDGALPRERLAGALETAQRASRSAKQLVQRLLAFGRLQSLEPVRLDVNALIDGMTDMMQRTLGEIIDIETRLVATPGLAYVDRNQLETALLNLVVNARDAMPNGGRVTIETANATIGAASRDDAPGDYVMLAVGDSGSGIPAALLSRVFEPFFTTKEPGKGSGLGLSMVYGFVKQSGGFVRVESREGRGTCVRVYLPRAPTNGGGDSVGATSPEARRADAAVEELLRAQPGDTVLLVEDHDDVRALGVAALKDLGYRVLEAADGASALQLLAALDGPVAVLFTDVVLRGGMTGTQLAAAVRELRPAVPVLFTSGYTGGALDAAAAPGVRAPLLAKPYSTLQLAAALRTVIAGGPGPGERRARG